MSGGCFHPVGTSSRPDGGPGCADRDPEGAVLKPGTKGLGGWPDGRQMVTVWAGSTLRSLPRANPELRGNHFRVPKGQDMSESEETVEATRAAQARDLFREVGPLWAAGIATVVLFLFAIQLLGTATEAAKPLLESSLDRILVGDSTALGLSWVSTYVLTNGSVVAALAVSLLTPGSPRYRKPS